MHAIVLWLIIGWLAFSAGCSIWLIGKPREPWTHGMAIFNITLTALAIAGIWYIHG